MNNSLIGISSILIPIFNCEDVIEECLLSLVVSNEIIEYDVNLILVNDGSTDKTEKLIRNFIKDNKEKIRINFICHKKNLGIEKALNSGIRKCKSEYIFRLDADDKWVEGRLVKSIRKFKELEMVNEKFAIVGTYMRGSSGKLYKAPIVVNSLFQHFFGGFVAHPSWCIKGDVLRKYLYEMKSPFDDYFLLLRLLLDNYHFFNIPEELVIYNDSSKDSKRLTCIKFNIRAINSFFIKFAFLKYWINKTFKNKNKLKKYKNIFLQDVQNIINKHSILKESQILAFIARYINSLLYKIYILFTL